MLSVNLDAPPLVRDLRVRCMSGGRGRLLTHVHRASACTLNAVGLLPVSGRGDAQGRPPLPHHFVCVEKSTLPYLTHFVFEQAGA